MYVVNNERNVNCELGYDRTLSIATMTFNGGNGAADDSLSNYKVIRVGDIAFEGHTNKVHAYGRFVLNDAGDGLMSPRFSCLRPIVEQRYSFWKYYIPREESMRPILVNATKNGTMMNELVPDDLMHESILVPCLAEQEVIGNSFSQLDHVITLHQRECGKPPFNQSPAWEQRKFSDLVLIERGGSPRPIDAYITEDPAGLNWVKIGDAPSMGRYITTTSEKIKPEGLSKTRQVYPGDLVLSNSMSFGRPYIMAVEGCIHDGWLLIRDTQNQFDPVFLCHMLGTPQMLDQYRMFASGSTVNNLNKELVGNAMVPLPDRDEQVKIGNYLDELDGLITLHQRMCPIFSFCAHGSRTNFAQTLQGWLQILRYPRPIPKMLVSPSAPASGVFGTAKGAFICASSSAGASTSSPSARKNFITSSTLCCRESLSSP